MNLVHLEDKDIVTQHRCTFLSGHKSVTEYRIISKCGDVCWLRDYSHPIWDDTRERVILVFGAAQDITRQKQAEEKRLQLETQLRQVQRLEALGTLAGGIAHDFNNILGTVLGYTELLLEDHPGEGQTRDFLKQVFQAGKRAKDLVKQILTFSRTHEQQQRTPTNIAPIIEKALKLIRATIHTNITIHPHLPADCPPILADATQIQQVIVNLCVNAGQAMKKHGGRLDVTLEKVTYDTDPEHILGLSKGVYVKLTISDTGCGMMPEVQEHLFEPFFTTKEVGEGTGLGLSVVHGIVKSHQGVITAKSESGTGTTFRIFFPTTEMSAAQAGSLREKSLSIGKKSILIVDDEIALTELYEIVLTKRGYQVTALTSSVDALEMLRARPDQFDLVLLDQDMPKMTGIQLTQELRRIRTDIPILLVTGYSDDLSEKKIKGLGIRQVIMKPVRTAELIRIIRKTLGD